MAELRNVIIVTIGGARYAVELRWVREVVSLGFVTNVPTAPAALGGVCNLHGAILPVLDVGVLLGGTAARPARQGDSALVVEVEPVVCALRVDQVDHVASLPEAADPTAGALGSMTGGAGGEVMDAAGRPLVLLDPGRLIRQALALVTADAGRVA